MTRSIFDPTSPNAEHSGSTFLGPNADDRSHMPESAVDGVVEEDAQRDDIHQPSSDLIDMEAQTEAPNPPDPSNEAM